MRFTDVWYSPSLDIIRLVDPDSYHVLMSVMCYAMDDDARGYWTKLENMIFVGQL